MRKGCGQSPDNDTRRFLLQSVSHLATLCGCEAATAVLQYASVAPYMIKRMSPGQPLAGKTNPQAWARVLNDEFWEAALPHRLRGASGELCRLIRVYISIEDGECTVERDLGVFVINRSNAAQPTWSSTTML